MADKNQRDIFFTEIDLIKLLKCENQIQIVQTTGILMLQNNKFSRTPRTIQTLVNLTSIDLSNNTLSRFPGKWFCSSFKRLNTLCINNNKLHVLQDILELSKMKCLRELSIYGNPLHLLGNRIYLLQAMFECKNGV